LGVGTGLSAAAAIPQETIAASAARPAERILEWHFIFFSPGTGFQNKAGDARKSSLGDASYYTCVSGVEFA
jgi:hypothetical protein